MTTNRGVPRFRYITAITNAAQAAVTFSATHDFVPGQIISFRTSSPDGMKEVNEKRARVLSATAFGVVVELDTRGFTPFVYPSTASTPPIAVGVGSGIVPGVTTSTMCLDACFDMQRVP